MLARCMRLALSAAALMAPLQAATAGDWWMLQDGDDQGRICAPPPENDGITMGPEEILKRFEGCKLATETPSLALDYVMVKCGGNINQVFVFTKTKDRCEALIKD